MTGERDLRRRSGELRRRAGADAGDAVVQLPTAAWQLSAWCAVPTGVDPDDAADMFDAFDEPTAEPGRLEMVRAICSACVVLAECRAFALAADGPRHGFLGGLTAEERAAVRAGDPRPHEQIVVDERARPRRPHGGDRRGVGWREQGVVDAREMAGGS